jgi:hypothetical protein
VSITVVLVFPAVILGGEGILMGFMQIFMSYTLSYIWAGYIETYAIGREGF